MISVSGVPWPRILLEERRLRVQGNPPEVAERLRTATVRTARDTVRNYREIPFRGEVDGGGFRVHRRLPRTGLIRANGRLVPEEPGWTTVVVGIEADLGSLAVAALAAVVVLVVTAVLHLVLVGLILVIAGIAGNLLFITRQKRTLLRTLSKTLAAE